MKILNVCCNFDSVTGGGEAERTFQMTKFLLAAGECCRILTLDTGLDEERKNALGEGTVIAVPCLQRRFYVPKVSLAHIRRLVDQADVVHLIGHWTVINALVYWAIRKSRKPYVVCPAGALSIFGRSKILKRIYNFLVGRNIIRHADMCIAVTPEERRYFISFGVAQDRIVVIPNGIAADDFACRDMDLFRRKHSIRPTPYILFLGRLNLIKGPDLLLRAFIGIKDRVENVDLVFAGPDGGMQRDLERLVQEVGLQSRVHFIGYVGGEEKSAAYHAAEVLVIPSRHEAMSIVALEAGICGTPVLLTDQCGFDQLQATGGGWVTPATVEGLEKGLTQILLNPEMRLEAASSIKRYVTETFSWDVLVHAYRNLYSRLLSKLA